MTAALPKYLYHFTYANRLGDIQETGLCPGRAAAIGHTGPYRAHSAGKLFLTHPDGAYFWHGKMEQHAEYNSDNLLEDELVPVVLRVEAEDLLDSGIAIHEDSIGSSDARAPAYYVTVCLNPDDILLEVWDGKGWAHLYEVSDLDLESAFDIQVEEPEPPDEDDEFYEEPEPVELIYFKNESPFLPPELQP